MTPKKKAKQLFEQMFNVSDKLNKYPMCFDTAKACALICVSEILKTINVENNTNTEILNRMYWINVTEEIRNL